LYGNELIPCSNNIKTNSKDYLYPHNYPNSYVKQQYLPDKLVNRKYFKPKKNKFENFLKQLGDSPKRKGIFQLTSSYPISFIQKRTNLHVMQSYGRV
jgi:hypothetical protein